MMDFDLGFKNKAVYSSNDPIGPYQAILSNQLVPLLIRGVFVISPIARTESFLDSRNPDKNLITSGGDLSDAKGQKHARDLSVITYPDRGYTLAHFNEPA